MNAIATINPGKPAVTKTVTVSEAQPETITVTMTIAQARAVQKVFCSVGGSDRFTERRLVDEVFNAICTTGIGYSTAEVSGSIYFKD